MGSRRANIYELVAFIIQSIDCINMSRLKCVFLFIFFIIIPTNLRICFKFVYAGSYNPA